MKVLLWLTADKSDFRIFNCKAHQSFQHKFVHLHSSVDSDTFILTSIYIFYVFFKILQIQQS